MVSIPSIQPIQQEPSLTRQEQVITYRYVSRLTPERVRTLTPLEKEQALLEFLTLFNLILSVLYNPVAEVSTRLLALDIIVTQVQRSARKIIASVTDKSPTFAPETEKRLGLSKNTISKGYKTLEKAGVLSRTHRTDETTRQEHLDIQPATTLFTAPEVIRDKKKRAAPKPQLGKPVDVTKHCLECDSHNVRVTCRDCGSFIDLGEAASCDASADEPQEEETRHKICADTHIPIPITKFVTASENEVRESPITPPLDAEEILSHWLEQRIGEGQFIYATGQRDQNKKYKSLRAGSVPNIQAYLRGDPRHIYGSRLATNTTTRVLCFDLDSAEQSSQYETYLHKLSQAGAKPVYWHRQQGRGHLELYFSEPVNAEAAYHWCLCVCPELAAIPECYPCRDKKANGLSWPLYQRVGNKVYECAVSFWTDECLHTFPGIQTDLQIIAELIRVAVTPRELIPELPQTRPETPPAQPVRGGGYWIRRGRL